MTVTTHAMILAAGRGRRLRPLTDRVPKPLLEIGGEYLIERHIRALVAAGVSDIVINIAWLGAAIRAQVGDGGRLGARVHWSDEGTRALETGGGIVRALPLLGDQPFLLVNGDVWTRFDIGTLTPLAGGALANLLLVPNPEHNPGGDFALEREWVVPGATLTYAGIAALDPRLFRGRRDGRFALGPLLHAAVVDGTVRGQQFAGAWFDVGEHRRLAEARAFAGGGVPGP